jgi:hypothetical protein
MAMTMQMNKRLGHHFNLPIDFLRQLDLVCFTDASIFGGNFYVALPPK